MTTNSNKSLTAAEQRFLKFAEHYTMNGFNATLSYMAVYQTTNYNSASTSAARLLKNEKVIAFIAQIEAAPVDYSLKKSDIIESNVEIRDKAILAKKYGDAIRANEQISKLSGFYEPDKVEHTGDINFSFGGEISKEEKNQDSIDNE